MTACPELDPAAPLQFVINAAAGSSDADTKREVIESVLQAEGRRGDLHFCSPADLARVAREQFGAEPEDTLTGTPGEGSMAALVLRPIGTLSMMGLMLHGAMGRLGEAAGVERFEFEHLVVKPTLPQGRRGVKVAFDGEVTMMHAPLDFRVLAKPLYLLKTQRNDAAADDGSHTDKAGR